MTKIGNVLLCTGAFLLMCRAVAGKFENDMLYEHNSKRSRHGCPKLVLDAELSKGSQDWADTIAERGTLDHSDSNGEYGENLYMGGGSAESAVNSWYGEMQSYSWDKPQFSANTGHFTALIWKSSKKLGVGIARRGMMSYVVARYKPAGNTAGQFNENVPRLDSFFDFSGACQMTLASSIIIFSAIFQIFVFIFRSNF